MKTSYLQIFILPTVSFMVQPKVDNPRGVRSVTFYPIVKPGKINNCIPFF